MKVINLFSREVLFDSSESANSPEFVKKSHSTPRLSNIIHLEGGSFEDKLRAVGFVAKAAKCHGLVCVSPVNQNLLDLEWIKKLGNVILHVNHVEDISEESQNILNQYIEENNEGGPLLVTTSKHLLKDISGPLYQEMVENILPCVFVTEDSIKNTFEAMFTA